MTAQPTYPALPPAGLPEPYLVAVGDIGVTEHWVVTPRGTVPVAGSEWWVGERVGWTQQIPVWAIVLAIVFFPIGLLFLLVKENRYTAWVDVTVRSAGLVHSAAIAAQSYEAAQAHARVAFARDLAAAAARG